MRKIVAVVALALLCAGCSMQQDGRISSLSEAEYAKIAPEEDGLIALEPSALLTEDEQLILALYGSSSCPPVPMQFSVDPGTVQITLKQYGSALCTADFGGPHLFSIDLSDNLPKNEQFNVVFDDYDDMAIPVTILGQPE